MKEQIRKHALKLGFDDCRFTSADAPDHAQALHEWLAGDNHGEMAWLARNAAKRADPTLVLPGARSVVALAVGYGGTSGTAHGKGQIARYAQHADYHDILGPKLKELATFVDEEGGPETRSLWYIDTGPILERDLGQRSGLGFVGKHTNLIHPTLGNWFIISEILTTLPLEPDTSSKNRCGTCTRCIQACPTQAITAPFRLDARRCISYLTIELKGPIPEEFRPAIGNRIFGCDDCLAVCPWNRFAHEGNLLKEHVKNDLAAPNLVELLGLDEGQFKARFAGTPVLRTKRRGLLRNVCVALGNSKDLSVLPALHKAAADPEPLIAEHARWAIQRLEEMTKSSHQSHGTKIVNNTFPTKGNRTTSQRQAIDASLQSVHSAGVQIKTLGEPCFDSPVRLCVSDSIRVPERIVFDSTVGPKPGDDFELAGPRQKLFFDASKSRAGIVTCGGLCPGLNNVIRSLFLQLHHWYGVKEVLGFRDGYQGLDPARGRKPMVLNSDLVDDIHKEGGTMLGTSRGPVDTGVAVDNLIRLGVDMLFTIGGDGTQRGGNDLYQEAWSRGHKLAVVGIPKTIDNDVMYVDRSFGYLTAVEEAARVLDCAHMEAHSVQNGISIVKLMGREAGFIAAGATVASQDVNFTLIPEVPFKMEGSNGFLEHLKRRVLKRSHAVIVVAEGAGQDLLRQGANECDASGNKKLGDIGLWLKDRVQAFFKEQGVPSVIRYFDPSYIIRSVKADSEDAILCDLFARNAAHAAMAGKTGLVIGLVHDHFVHVPIEKLAKQKKNMREDGPIWQAVLATTGQPARFE